MKLSSFISRGRTDGLSYSIPFSTWVSIEIPARPVPPTLCQRAESLQNTWIQPRFPTDARRALEWTLHPLPPELVPSSHTAVPWVPLCPLTVLGPTQGTAVPLQPGDRTTVAVGYSQRSTPISSRKLRRGENLEGNWAQSNAALPQVPWNNRRPGCHGSITAMECGWCPMDHQDGSSKEVLGPHTTWTRGVSTPPNQP